jgi:hypothetical protein
VSVLVLVILGKHQVPNLGKAPTTTAGTTGRLPTANLLAEVIVNLAAGSAGSGITGRSPEILLFAKSQYSFLRNTLLPPVAKSLVIIKKDAYP